MNKYLSLNMMTTALLASLSSLVPLSYQLFESPKTTEKGFKDTISAIEVIGSLS